METVRQVLDRQAGELATIAPEATMLDALRLMAERNIGSVVVLEGGGLAGLLTERDYARKVVLAGRRSADTSVRDVMATEVPCATLAQRVDECMAIMTEARVRHLPVLEGDRLVGIVSIGDLVRSTIADQEQTIDDLKRYIHS